MSAFEQSFGQKAWENLHWLANWLPSFRLALSVKPHSEGVLKVGVMLAEVLQIQFPSPVRLLLLLITDLAEQLQTHQPPGR